MMKVNHGPLSCTLHTCAHLHSPRNKQSTIHITNPTSTLAEPFLSFSFLPLHSSHQVSSPHPYHQFTTTYAHTSTITTTTTMQTRITRLFGIQHPIILPGMSWISKPKLVAAVSQAGGCGILATGPLTAKETEAAIKEIRSITDKPFGIGCTLMMPVCVCVYVCVCVSGRVEVG